MGTRVLVAQRFAHRLHLLRVHLVAGQFDFSGPLDDQRQFLYRLVGLERSSGTQFDHIKDDKTFIAPSFTWRPNDDTSLTVLADYSEVAVLVSRLTWP